MVMCVAGVWRACGVPANPNQFRFAKILARRV
jgi:hypothetical protein